jgi:predicted Rossmann-fold nucleotide-binding protein
MITNTGHEELKDVMAYLNEVPFDVARKSLYHPAELYEGYNPDDESSYSKCFDSIIYQRYMSMGQLTNNVNELLARTLHDYSIHTAMARFFKTHDHQHSVGVMGGHALLRTDKIYRDIAFLSQRLTQEGFIMLSGGGPGAMEATHLGAWMAGFTGQDLDDALDTMMPAPSFKDPGWLQSAFGVIDKYPQQEYVSLGIPTWRYGHEPSTPFATHIAKFFENSIREDNILTLAFGGIIYAPGSAGTLQEIFQEAVQNHYLSFGFSSPMIFLGKQFWTQEIPVYPLLESLMETGKYKNLLLTLTDDIDEVVHTLQAYSQQSAGNIYSKQS